MKAQGRVLTSERPTIQAVDDPDGTIYILRRAGEPDVMAPWPHPLLELAPDAVRVQAHLGAADC